MSHGLTLFQKFTEEHTTVYKTTRIIKCDQTNFVIGSEQILKYSFCNEYHTYRFKDTSYLEPNVGQRKYTHTIIFVLKITKHI